MNKEHYKQKEWQGRSPDTVTCLCVLNAEYPGSETEQRTVGDKVYQMEGPKKELSAWYSE